MHVVSQIFAKDRSTGEAPVKQDGAPRQGITVVILLTFSTMKTWKPITLQSVFHGGKRRLCTGCKFSSAFVYTFLRVWSPMYPPGHPKQGQ